MRSVCHLGCRSPRCKRIQDLTSICEYKDAGYIRKGPNTWFDNILHILRDYDYRFAMQIFGRKERDGDFVHEASRSFEGTMAQLGVPAKPGPAKWTSRVLIWKSFKAPFVHPRGSLFIRSGHWISDNSWLMFQSSDSCSTLSLFCVVCRAGKTP